MATDKTTCTVPIGPFKPCGRPGTWRHKYAPSVLCDHHARQFWGSGKPTSKDWEPCPPPEPADPLAEE